MAIQIPNPGTGNGASGDNEFVLWSKVKSNFEDQTHAASRLVGTATGGLVENKSGLPLGGVSIGGTGWGGTQGSATTNTDAAVLSELLSGGSRIYRTSGENVGIVKRYGTTVYARAYDSFISISGGVGSLSGGYDVLVTTGLTTGGLANTATHKLYSDKNTTKDVGTGFLKASSPVLHVYNDKIDKIHEAEQLDITVDKKGVGHYEIHGTTGLRQNDGWNMSPPRDIHGNVRCMIEVTEKDGVITVKTYKRKFDLELAAIVHDYDNPLDIPDGACVELRFNDLPYENLYDTQTEA